MRNSSKCPIFSLILPNFRHFGRGPWREANARRHHHRPLAVRALGERKQQLARPLLHHAPRQGQRHAASGGSNVLPSTSLIAPLSASHHSFVCNSGEQGRSATTHLLQNRQESEQGSY